MRSILFLALAGPAFLAPGAPSAQPAALAAYWPHEDGRTWFYDQHSEELVPVPTVVDDQATLRFDGTTVAAGGIAAQVLAGFVSSPSAAGAILASAVPAGVRSPFLRQLWLARPDLRAAIQRAAVEAPCPTDAVPGWSALLLAGGLAYAQDASEAAAWRCDLPNTRSWLWLTSDLTPGSTTTIPLVPDLADDVFLHLTVLGLEDVTVPAGAFADCLHVDYEIDYGQSECTDEGGGATGTFTATTTGFVRYAPDVGPIESFEEFEVVQLTGSCPGPTGTLARVSLQLNAPTVPARASSWGKLKAAYRF